MNEDTTFFYVHEGAVEYGKGKPVICPKCERGKLGSIPEWCEAIVSRRGRPPPGESVAGVEVKCPVCRKLWTITTK